MHTTSLSSFTLSISFDFIPHYFWRIFIPLHLISTSIHSVPYHYFTSPLFIQFRFRSFRFTSMPSIQLSSLPSAPCHPFPLHFISLYYISIPLNDLLHLSSFLFIVLRPSSLPSTRSHSPELKKYFLFTPFQCQCHFHLTMFLIHFIHVSLTSPLHVISLRAVPPHTKTYLCCISFHPIYCSGAVPR